MLDLEVLIALLRDKKDFAILQTDGWYRIPVEHTPRRCPPETIAFYQPKAIVYELLHLKYPNHGKLFRALEKAYLEAP